MRLLFSIITLMIPFLAFVQEFIDNNASDKERMGINGNVKTVRMKYLSYIGSDGSTPLFEHLIDYFVFDTHGNITSKYTVTEENKDTSRTTFQYEYDNSGQIKRKIKYYWFSGRDKATGDTTFFSYDSLGRLSRIHFSYPEEGTDLDPFFQFEYNEQGQLTEKKALYETLKYAYDKQGKLAKITCYKPSSSLKSTVVMTYPNDTTTIEMIYDSEMHLTEKRTNYVTAKGKAVKEELQLGGGQVMETVSYYNTHQDPIGKAINYLPNWNPSRFFQRSRYKYDEYGNWVSLVSWEGSISDGIKWISYREMIYE